MISKRANLIFQDIYAPCQGNASWNYTDNDISIAGLWTTENTFWNLNKKRKPHFILTGMMKISILCLHILHTLFIMLHLYLISKRILKQSRARRGKKNWLFILCTYGLKQHLTLYFKYFQLWNCLHILVVKVHILPCLLNRSASLLPILSDLSVYWTTWRV